MMIIIKPNAPCNELLEALYIAHGFDGSDITYTAEGTLLVERNGKDEVLFVVGKVIEMDHHLYEQKKQPPKFRKPVEDFLDSVTEGGSTNIDPDS